MANTSQKTMQYGELINAESINVTLDGVLYSNVPRIVLEENAVYGYGDERLTTDDEAQGLSYPFCIVSVKGQGNIFFAPRNYSGHDYQLSVSIPSSTEVTTTPCFDKARGYECKEEWVTLTDESVTTTSSGSIARARLAYSTLIDANTIKVTFNGTEYVCDRYDDGFAFTYGALNGDFSEYPFALASLNGNIALVTETAGTYQVKIEAPEVVVETSECFEKAVHSSVANDFFLNIGETVNGSTHTLDKTAKEITDAFSEHKLVRLFAQENDGTSCAILGGVFETNFSFNNGSLLVDRVAPNEYPTYQL